MRPLLNLRSFVLPPATALACAVFASACVPADSRLTPVEFPDKGVTCFTQRFAGRDVSCVKTAPETVFVKILSSGKPQLRPGVEVDSLRLALR